MDVPFPYEEKLLLALVHLARLMSKCVARIYKQHHDSLLPLWNAANDIRRELRQFAEQQRQDLNFGLVSDPNTGELGVCQTIISTMYHHTLLLTFRPFLVLRAKLRQEDPTGSTVLPTPPAWLDTACEYCLDAARHSIAFLSGVFRKNQLCRDIRYHGFFLEGASHVLAFDLLQEKATDRASFQWVELAVRTLQLLKPRSIISQAHPVDLSGNLERMVQAVYPDFRVDSQGLSPLAENPTAQQSAAKPPTNLETNTTLPPILFPFTPFGLDEAGSSSTQSPSAVNPEAPADLSAADVGWNFDFATMNMEAFLSFDPNLATDFTMYR